MESVRTGRGIDDILRVAMLLCLALAWPVGAESGSPESADPSFAPAVMSGASRPQPDEGRPVEPTAERSDVGSDEYATSLRTPAETDPFGQTPLAAWFLVAVCLLGAGLGPHARRHSRSAEADAAHEQGPPSGREVAHTELTDPRRTTG